MCRCDDGMKRMFGTQVKTYNGQEQIYLGYLDVI